MEPLNVGGFAELFVIRWGDRCNQHQRSLSFRSRVTVVVFGSPPTIAAVVVASVDGVAVHKQASKKASKHTTQQRVEKQKQKDNENETVTTAPPHALFDHLGLVTAPMLHGVVCAGTGRTCLCL